MSGMRRALVVVVAALALAGADRASAAPVQQAPIATPAPSIAVGKPWRGRLVRGVQLPVAGAGFLSWDALKRRWPDRGWRRWGTDALVSLLERVAAEFAVAHPEAGPILIQDLSRPRGGVFDERFGGLGHASHQNGLDADVAYPRADGKVRPPAAPWQVDRWLAQDLVDRFVAAGAERVFVGPSLGLGGPPRVVQELVFHDDHLHVRIPNPGR
jgi:murein endopeptidase